MNQEQRYTEWVARLRNRDVAVVHLLLCWRRSLIMAITLLDDYLFRQRTIEKRSVRRRRR